MTTTATVSAEWIIYGTKNIPTSRYDEGASPYLGVSCMRAMFQLVEDPHCPCENGWPDSDPHGDMACWPVPDYLHNLDVWGPYGT